MSNKPLPRIPLEVFSKMIHSVSLDTLRELPASKLPREIPQDVLRGVTGERREILDDLLFEANSHHVRERLALEGVFGPDFIHALDQSKKDPESAVRDALKTHIDKFVDIAQRFLESQDEYSTDAVARGVEALDPEIKKTHIETLDIQRYTKMLSDGFHLAGEYQPEFKDALAGMKQQVKVFDLWLGKYYTARLQLVTFHLAEKLKEISEKNKKLKTIMWEMAELKKQIKSSSEAMGLSMAQANNNHFIQELRNDLQMMEAMKAECDAMIPEESLTRWMDVLIDGYLCPVDSEVLDTPLAATRQAMSALLLKYCEIQSQAAEEIADKEFFVLDKEKNIQYMLETERFVKRYFKEKDLDVKSWGASEQKLETLAGIEQSILTEIQDYTQFSR